MLLRAYRTALRRVNMLKDNIEKDIEEIKLMIYGLKEIDKNTILSSLLLSTLFGRNDE
jgi:hypothetical protein